ADEPDHRLDEREPDLLRVVRERRVLLEHPVDRPQPPASEDQPADAVARLPRGDPRADRDPEHGDERHPAAEAEAARWDLYRERGEDEDERDRTENDAGDPQEPRRCAH